MTRLKAGVIGVGSRGTYLYKLLSQSSEIEPAAVCDLIPEKTDAMRTYMKNERGIELRTYTDYHEMLASDIDVVIVATGVDTHARIAADCLYAGKHTLCEIPNIASLEEAKLLYRACRDNPRTKFMVAENCCYWAFIQSWKKMYDAGMIGDVMLAESDYLHETRSFMKPNTLTWRSYMPAVTYLTHNLGPLLYILGDTCDEVSGFIPDINPCTDHYIESPNGMCIIKTKKGTMIKIFIGFGIRHTFAHNFILYGSKGSLENTRQGPFDQRTTLATLDEAIPHTHGRELELPLKAGFPGGDNSGHGGADGEMMRAFVDCVYNDKKPPLDIEFGINIALPGILADKSSKNGGKPFRMPSLEEILAD